MRDTISYAIRRCQLILDYSTQTHTHTSSFYHKYICCFVRSTQWLIPALKLVLFWENNHNSIGFSLTKIVFEVIPIRKQYGKCRLQIWIAFFPNNGFPIAFLSTEKEQRERKGNIVKQSGFVYQQSTLIFSTC